MTNARLIVIYSVSGENASGANVSEDRLVEIVSDGTIEPPVPVPLKQPINDFFIAGVRGGSAPSMTIDLLGSVGNAVRYARIRLK